MARRLGGSLLETADEFQVRNQVLAHHMGQLINQYVHADRGRGLDVGCKYGALADILTELTPLKWSGIDPVIASAVTTAAGAELVHGWAHDMPYDNGAFDCLLFANVYEHVAPELRRASVREMARVLAPGGILVGQLPNPYFPIESHSRLPLMGWLPVGLQKRYWRFAPVPWEHDFHVVTIRNLADLLTDEGFDMLLMRTFNYPVEAVPKAWRWAARILELPMRFVPWSWQFVARKRD